MSRHVVITGASSGIGAACARSFHSLGYRLSLGARRVEELMTVVDGASCHFLDVTQPESIEEFLDHAESIHGPIDVLINNAGLARGTEKIHDATGEAWREMIETNLIGVLEVTRRVLPKMVHRKQGDIVMIGSIAGHKSYAGGGVYCASKRALQSVCEAIRTETNGSNVRVISVDPGMVQTDFALVRYRGDQEKAAKVYEQTRPLQADDVADCVTFAVTRPAYVNVETLVLMPTDQANPQTLHRGGGQ
ncbi:MAG: SDR family NAD(P)-dependent oxidoreductase [Planctomycetota bacterium]|nr:SDR family NAD(P)-dependent oxidoreductase [Planctomycetota bacterium]